MNEKPTPENWREEFNNFVLINDLYPRGVNVGKLEAFIESLLIHQDQVSRETVLKELSTLVHRDYVWEGEGGEEHISVESFEKALKEVLPQEEGKETV